MLTILSNIGLISLAISLLMLVSQFLSADFMNKDRRKEYFLISQKPKDTRSKEEQYLIDQTWHQYYITKIRNMSFKIGIIIMPIVFLLYYIIDKLK